MNDDIDFSQFVLEQLAEDWRAYAELENDDITVEIVDAIIASMDDAGVNNELTMRGKFYLTKLDKNWREVAIKSIPADLLNKEMLLAVRRQLREGSTPVASVVSEPVAQTISTPAPVVTPALPTFKPLQQTGVSALFYNRLVAHLEEEQSLPPVIRLYKTVSDFGYLYTIEVYDERGMKESLRLKNNGEFYDTVATLLDALARYGTYSRQEQVYTHLEVLKMAKTQERSTYQDEMEDRVLYINVKKTEQEQSRYRNSYQQVIIKFLQENWYVSFYYQSK
ncbi:hypothetical protein [Entomospira culicis]|uniref:Uncharacterized protein n=1 Tax=Entomospira culicis TaxID=2719989 RepID=A0A968KWF7_9SPIO|nr:hypothetical protein [Entomospira culicis]NIZ18942.1 hypothetical protein [Entomospira culicis]NIZ69157.1 hypothetical protein [Entomospira culicis]WDI37744.1 hypothetical protein PVA46_02880 [Entomospira culicis]WDI39372.1 hypothetical protein PVA47_02885 [Entomospira culicis]